MTKRLWGANHTLAAIGIVAATIGLPGTLWAVDQFTKVALVDPISGKKAKVTDNRALVVTGTVNANPAPLLNTFRGNSGASSGDCALLAQPASGKSLLVKTINIAGYELSASNHHVELSIGATCGANVLQFAHFQAPDNKSLVFEPGVVVPEGQKLWAVPHNLSTSFLVTGFQLPSSALLPPGSSGP